jgi:hypothetical protein
LRENPDHLFDYTSPATTGLSLWPKYLKNQESLILCSPVLRIVRKAPPFVISTIPRIIPFIPQ